MTCCLCRYDAFLPSFFCIFIQVIRILLKANMQQVPVIEEMKPSRQSHACLKLTTEIFEQGVKFAQS